LHDVVDGVSPDYAVIAQKGADEARMRATGHAFEAEYGLTLEGLMERFDRQTARLSHAVHAQAEAPWQSAIFARAASAWDRASITLAGEITLKNKAIATREAEIARLNQELGAREAKIAAIYRSTSWRMTAPIRGAKRAAIWLVTGTWSWITLRPGSRPRRLLGSANLPSAIAPAWGIDPDPDVLTAWRNIIDGNK
jgi:O-antigen chain-terminating methyltransferase